MIVDAPATGHGLAMLRAPRTYATSRASARSGARPSGSTRSSRDPALTGVLAVALPEEMPVNETIEFERALGDELGHGDRRDRRERGASRSASRPDEAARLEAVTGGRHGRAGRARARRSRSTAARAASTRSCGGCGARPRRR